MNEITEVSSVILNLSSAKVSVRKRAIRHINLVFKKLNTKRLFSEFFPYLYQLASLDESDWNKILCETEKMDFASFSDEDLEKFVIVIERLSYKDSMVFALRIRRLIIECSKHIEKTKITKYFFPIFSFLVKQQWFPSQIASLTAFPCICKYLSKTMIQTFFNDSCALLYSAENVQVTSIFIDMISKTMKFLPDDTKSNCFMFVSELSKSQEPTFLISQSIINFLVQYSKYTNDKTEDCLEIGDRILHSMDWLIKVSYIENMHLLTNKAFNKTIQSIYKEIIIDTSKEVRKAAAKTISLFDFDNNDIKEDIKSIIKTLVNDNDASVKENALHSLKTLAAFVGSDFVLECVISSINDDNQLVKLAAVGVIDSGVIPIDASIDTICKGTTSFGWREKVLITEILTNIIKSSKERQLPQRLASVIGLMLHDECAAVRDSCARRMGEYIDAIGDRLDKTIFVKLFEKSGRNADYQIRQTIIQAIASANLFDLEKQLINDLLHDPVSNVRLVIAKYAPLDIAKELQDDSDEDVRETYVSRL